MFFAVLLPAPSPALPEAMAGATSMGGYRESDPARRHRPMIDGASKLASGGYRRVEPAVAVRDMWFHHPS